MISRENNFDLIRLIAALEVAIAHTLEHLECNMSNFTEFAGGNLFHFPISGVFCFFVISGFLITSSYERNPQFKKYLKNRILRIVPALWLAFILICLVLIYFGFINSETLSIPQFWGWVIGQLTIFQFYTPDVLRSFGVSCPNGSLWTIPVEFIFYLLLPLIFYMFKKRKNVTMILCSIISIAINMILNRYNDGGVIYKLIGCSVIPWLYSFLLGSLIYINWNKLKYFIEGKGLIYIFLYGIFVNLVAGPSYELHSILNLIANLLLGIMTLSLAYTKPKFGNFLHGVDISYGLYVYHMIVVNVFVQLEYVGKISYAIICLSISIFIALLSWKFLESKILKLKNVKMYDRNGSI